MFCDSVLCMWEVKTLFRIRHGRHIFLKYGTRRHSLTKMLLRADECNCIVPYFQATPRSKSREAFRHSWGSRNRRISEVESYSCLCSTASNTRNLEQSVAEESERYPLCEEDCHGQGRLSVYLTEVPKPCDRRKQIILENATIPVKDDHQSFRWKKDTGDLCRKQRDMNAIRSRFRSMHRPLFDTNLKFENWTEQYIGPNLSKDSYVESWNFDAWLEMLTTASNKMRFEYGFDARREPHFMRSIQGRSGVPEVNPKLLTLLEIPYEWKTQFYHTGSSKNYRSIIQGGLIGGGTR